MMWVLAGPALGAVALYLRHRRLTWSARRVASSPVAPPRLPKGTKTAVRERI